MLKVSIVGFVCGGLTIFSGCCFAKFTKQDPDAVPELVAHFAVQDDLVSEFLQQPSSSSPNYLNSTPKPEQQWTTANGSVDYMQPSADGFSLHLPYSPHESNNFNGFSYVDQQDLTHQSLTGGQLKAKAVCLSAVIADFGVAVARSFKLGVSDLMPRLDIGFAPKFQKLSTYHFRESANESDEIVSDDYNHRVEDTSVNFDAGATLHLDSWQIGLAADNLISRKLETAMVDGAEHTYLMEPQFNLSARYQGQNFIWGGDLDLAERNGFEGMNMPQYARLGVESNLYEGVTWHAGYDHDLNAESNNLWSAGVRLYPIKTFNVDVKGDYSDSGEVGGAIKFGLVF